MKWVAVTTVGDEGAAQIAKEALEGRDIPVELRRVPKTAYVAAADEIEVRVPEENLEQAQAALEQFHSEVEQAVLAEAGVPPAEDETVGPGKPRDLALTPRRIGWSIAIAAIAPVPCVPMGMIYARAPRWLYLVLSVGFAALFVTGKSQAMLVAFVAPRILDIVLAPIFAVRENRRLMSLGVDVPSQRIPAPLIVVMVLIAGVFAAGMYLAATHEQKWSQDDYATHS
jgi:hypothetical protein